MLPLLHSQSVVSGSHGCKLPPDRFNAKFKISCIINSHAPKNPIFFKIQKGYLYVKKAKA